MEGALDSGGIANGRTALKRGIESDTESGVQLQGFSFARCIPTRDAPFPNIAVSGI